MKRYSTHEAAERLGLRPQTLYNWRCNRKGPAYILMGSKPVYREEDLAAYETARRVDPEADYTHN